MRIRMNIGERNRRKVKMSKSSVLELAKKLVAAKNSSYRTLTIEY